MGIVSNRNGLAIEGTEAKIDKSMGTEPRRITEIKIDFYFPMNFSNDEKMLLEKAAINCPAAKSSSSGSVTEREIPLPFFLIFNQY